MAKSKKVPGVLVFKQRSNLPQGVSREETELANVIKLEFPKKKIERSNRQILGGRELDIYIPENKVAFEYDGVYFHSTAKKDDEFYHLWKTVECEKRGIRLIHVLSDEWELKKPLVIDLVRKALGKYRLLSANECTVAPLERKEEEIFLNANHLLGDFPESVLCLGLLYQNVPVMEISFAKQENLWMIVRISTKRGYEVENGLAKLVAYFIKNYSNENLYISIDRRFEDASDILECGFKEIQPTNPNATYTKDFQHRFREKDFKKFNEATLLANGWQKLYDCGRRRFVLNNN